MFSFMIDVIGSLIIESMYQYILSTEACPLLLSYQTKTKSLKMYLKK